jgi:hypothetical protein
MKEDNSTNIQRMGMYEFVCEDCGTRFYQNAFNLNMHIMKNASYYCPGGLYNGCKRKYHSSYFKEHGEFIKPTNHF